MLELLDDSEHGPMIAASHGTWIARALEGIGITCPTDLWHHMPNPAVFAITYDPTRIQAFGRGVVEQTTTSPE